MIEQIIFMLCCLAGGLTVAYFFGIKTDKDNKKVCDKHYKNKEKK